MIDTIRTLHAHDVAGAVARHDGAVMSGRFMQEVLGSGLEVHGSDATEHGAFSVESSIDAGLSCIFFAQGEIEIEIGSNSFAFDPAAKRGMDVHATAIMSAHADSFHRRTARRQHIRHLVVTVTPEWLETEGFPVIGDHRAGDRMLRNHLAHRSWRPSPRLAGLVGRMLAPAGQATPLQRLYRDAWALEIVAETLSVLTGSELSHDTAGPAPRRQACVARARSLIEARLAEPLTVRDIARAAGTSATALQYHFHQVEGCSIIDYLRNRRLTVAHEALVGGASVADAAALVGYANPANFATTFRRRFGCSPREAARGLDAPGRPIPPSAPVILSPK